MHVHGTLSRRIERTNLWCTSPKQKRVKNSQHLTIAKRQGLMCDMSPVFCDLQGLFFVPLFSDKYKTAKHLFTMELTADTKLLEQWTLTN